MTQMYHYLKYVLGLDCMAMNEIVYKYQVPSQDLHLSVQIMLFFFTFSCLKILSTVIANHIFHSYENFNNMASHLGLIIKCYYRQCN